MALTRKQLTLLLVATIGAALTGCSVTTTPDACSADSTFTCVGTAIAYSCTGGATPTQTDSLLSCDPGVPGANGATDYCCAATGALGTCAADTSVAGCTGAATGFSCSGTDTPSSSDPSLSCGAAVTGANGLLDYCCQPIGTSGSCSPDASVAGCSGGSSGFSCTSSDAPDQSNPALVCSAPISGSAGESLYCCSGFSTSSSCQPDSSVVGCTGGSHGFSCTSTDTPSQADSSLICSAPTSGSSGELLYCCDNFSSSSCQQDSSVVGCTGGSFGFSCTSTDTPTQADPSLVCSTPTSGNSGELIYCCSN
ncbi:MAG TPA: hypothetical protein VGI10_17950 [Polyangiaceae bacterium]